MVEINPACIFGGSIDKWGWNKLRFVSWLIFYRSINYAYDEPPPKRIIRNDWELDRWVEKKREERRISLYGKDNTTAASGHKRTPKDGVTFGSDIIKQ